MFIVMYNMISISLYLFRSTESYRRQLHGNFALPTDRPLLRKACRYTFPEDVSTGGYLLNPHIGLAPSGGKYLN